MLGLVPARTESQGESLSSFRKGETVNKRRTLSTMSIGLAAALATGAAAESSGDDDLRARIDALEARIAQLQQTSGDAWLTEARAGEIRSLVTDVLADAETRTSLLQGGATAGWDDGFFLSSPDGNFTLKILGQLQFRYVYSGQDNGPDDDNRGGFENARTKLRFTGNVVDPSWIYMIEGNFDRDGGAFGLEDAYIGKVLGDSGWTFLAGQFKVPMLREELVYSAYQQAVERTLVNEEFTAGRTQGVAIDYRNDMFHVVGGFTDGHPATGGFNMPALAADTEYSLTARAEALLNGTWDQFNDLPSFKGDSFGFLVGGALHYQEGEFGTAADELEVFQWTVDGSLEFGGANIFGYFVGRHLESTTVDLDQFGAVLQGGVFVTEDWEVFGRYEWGDLDIGEDLNLVTIGATKYFSGHQLKWTTDVGYGLDEVSSMWGGGFIGGGADPTGWRTDAADEDGQIVIRSQLQLLF